MGGRHVELFGQTGAQEEGHHLRTCLFGRHGLCGVGGLLGAFCPCAHIEFGRLFEHLVDRIEVVAHRRRRRPGFFGHIAVGHRLGPFFAQDDRRRNHQGGTRHLGFDR